MHRHRELVPLIGSSPRMSELRAEVEQIAVSDAKVLVTGESGAGKEVVARQIHVHSPRRSKPFVAINCAGIPETLLESELFGHVKGSFTGAFRDKPGRLEMAAGGTMFLDEVGEMSVRMQGLLLRFLETGELEKVGADRVTHVGSVRIISATHRNLRERIGDGTFREDLYYRLNVISVVVPPLRDHVEDIPQLVDAFLARLDDQARPEAQTMPYHGNGQHRSATAISAAALDALMQYHWPGNVRELENVLERLIVASRGSTIDVRHLPEEIRGLKNARPAAAPSRYDAPSVADDLFRTLVKDGKPFWTTVYPMYMQREIARKDMRALVHRGLEEARGNYRIVLRMFNMESKDYKRFLNFLRKHDCRLPFKNYRKAG
jgi:transcriptional regulator with PAS, ATPase and Fis domain